MPVCPNGTFILPVSRSACSWSQWRVGTEKHKSIFCILTLDVVTQNIEIEWWLDVGEPRLLYSNCGCCIRQRGCDDAVQPS